MKGFCGVMRTRLTSDFVDARFCEVVCYCAAIFVFCGAVLKLCSMGLTEGQLMIGLLTAGSCMLLMIVIGLLIPLRIKLSSKCPKR